LKKEGTLPTTGGFYRQMDWICFIVEVV